MGMQMKLIASALAFGVFSLAHAADPIKIGVDGPFTGGSSSMGVSMRDGVRLATAEINKSAVCLAVRSCSSSAMTKRRTSAACRSRKS